MSDHVRTCAICGAARYGGHRNGAEPVQHGVCCDACMPSTSFRHGLRKYAPPNASETLANIWRADGLWGPAVTSPADDPVNFQPNGNDRDVSLEFVATTELRGFSLTAGRAVTASRRRLGSAFAMLFVGNIFDVELARGASVL
jgi:hypothetical protein